MNPLHIMYGPYELTGKSLVVKHPFIAVLFRNGSPYATLKPGNHHLLFGKIPILGEKEYLLFDTAPFSYTVSVGKFTLVDEATVSLEISLWITPRWFENPDILMSYCKRYGLAVDRYFETIRHEIQELVRGVLLDALRGMTHERFTTFNFKSYFEEKLIDGNLVSITSVTSVNVTPDDYFESARKIKKNSKLDEIRTLSNLQVQSHQDNYESEKNMRERIQEAKTNLEIANLYGVDPSVVAYPDYMEKLLTIQQNNAKFLLENSDLLSDQELNIQKQILGLGSFPHFQQNINSSLSSKSADKYIEQNLPQDDIQWDNVPNIEKISCGEYGSGDLKIFTIAIHNLGANDKDKELVEDLLEKIKVNHSYHEVLPFGYDFKPKNAVLLAEYLFEDLQSSGLIPNFVYSVEENESEVEIQVNFRESIPANQIEYIVNVLKSLANCCQNFTQSEKFKVTYHG